jgi:hypothetical protein
VIFGERFSVSDLFGPGVNDDRSPGRLASILAGRLKKAPNCFWSRPASRDRLRLANLLFARSAQAYLLRTVQQLG